MRKLFALPLLMVSLIFSAPAHAEILGFRCDGFYITIYDDGTPARIGIDWGIGSKALVYDDPRNNSWVVVELNGVGLPITLTTIMPDGRAIHSSQSTDVLGKDA